MISFLISALKIIILLGFLVLIHEGGHFLVAKLFKIKVNEFAIGFGPTIFTKEKGETKYALRLIPLGGFVSMEGEEERSDKEGSFSKASIPKRIAIVAAGGLVNIIFGILVYFIMTASAGNFYSTVVEYPIEDYAAESYGIVSGDKIIKINDKRINNKNDVDEAMSKCNGETISVTLIRNNEEVVVDLLPTVVESKDVGILFNGSEDNLKPKIAAISKDSPAQLAGIKENDVILEVNGKTVENNLYNVANFIQESTGNIILKIQRNDEIIDVEVVPNIIKTYYLGIVFAKAENTFLNNIYYGLIDTKEFSLSIIDNLKEMFTGNISVNQMTGIVGISDIVVSTKGINEYIYILALISLSLGVTNLLPMPPLDGGKIVIYIIEAIRRKPMKEETELKLQTLGFSLLIGLTIYVTYNDILRIF